MSRSLATSVVIALLAAGCLEAMTPGAPGVGEPGPAALDLDASFGDCFYVSTLFLVEIDRIQGVLPSGFAAREGGSFFGVPTETGRGGVFAGAYECGHHAFSGGSLHWAEVAALVEPPVVVGEGVEEPEWQNHIYTLERFAEDPRDREALAPAGYPVTLVEVFASASAPLADAAFEGRIADENGALVAFTFPAARPDTFTGGSRHWRVVPDGIAFFDFDVDAAPLRMGKVVSCDVRDGTILADILDAGDCADVPSVSVSFAAYDAESRFRFVPGATVVDGP